MDSVAAVKAAHVLVVSTVLDLATDAVVRTLGDWGVRTTRLNTEDYPFGARMTTVFDAASSGAGSRGHVAWEGSRIDDVSAVWYRRVRSPVRPDGMDLGVYDFCAREARAALLGTLLGDVRAGLAWMSPPSNVWAAEHKLQQLATAARLGLSIPETVVTNDAREVRAAFSRFRGQMIAKPVRSGYVEVGGEPRAIFTSQVLQQHLETLADIDASPVIYQPLIAKACDVRVTIVGSRIFTAEIDSQLDANARIDWRRTEDPLLPHRRSDLPPDVRQALLEMMTQLGLAFGAVDLIRTPDNQYTFLEVNPNGQWLWLDAQLDLGITDAIASWLADRGGVRSAGEERRPA